MKQRIPEPLQELERQLRQTLERYCYCELESLLEAMRTLAVEEARPEVTEWILNIVRWAVELVSIQRQTVADELDGLATVSHYLDRDPVLSSEVCMDL